MTPQQSESEWYLISKDELADLQAFGCVPFSLMSKLISSRPTPSQKSGCDGCRKEVEHLDCPMPGNCDQMKCPVCCESSDFPTLPEEIKKYEQEAAAQARDKLFEAIRAERDPHLDYVDWDSIEAAYMRTGGEPR